MGRKHPRERGCCSLVQFPSRPGHTRPRFLASTTCGWSHLRQAQKLALDTRFCWPCSGSLRSLLLALLADWDDDPREAWKPPAKGGRGRRSACCLGSQTSGGYRASGLVRGEPSLGTEPACAPGSVHRPGSSSAQTSKHKNWLTHCLMPDTVAPNSLKQGHDETPTRIPVRLEAGGQVVSRTGMAGPHSTWPKQRQRRRSFVSSDLTGSGDGSPEAALPSGTCLLGARWLALGGGWHHPTEGFGYCPGWPGL